MRNIILPVLLIFAACNPVEEFYNPVTVSEQYIPFSDGWHHEDSVSFTLDIPDVNYEYHVYLLLRHGRDYGYRNIWLSTFLESPSGASTQQRHELNLANERGVWYGLETGNFVDQRIPLHSNKKFDEAGKHKLYVRHIMRTDHLRSMQSAGILLQKAR